MSGKSSKSNTKTKKVKDLRNIGVADSSTTHSFRFDDQTWESFLLLLNRMNMEQGQKKRISGGQVMKGLIYLGLEVKTKKILDLINKNRY